MELGGQQLLGGLGADVALLGVGGVVVVIVQGHGLGADAVVIHHRLHRHSQLVEEIIGGVLGASLQLEDDVFLVAVDGVIEVAVLMDALHQSGDHFLTGLALGLLEGGHHLLAVLVLAGEGHHVALIIVADLDFRVDAEQQGAHPLGGVLGALGGGGGAGGEQSQGEYSGKGESQPFVVHLFHIIDLLSCPVWALFSLVEYGGRWGKPG